MSTARLDALAAFLPRTLLRALTEDSSRPRLGGGDSGPAVMLFADLSGFSTLAEALDRRGPDGAERLTELVDSCFSELLALVVNHGGDVLRFAGDALIALWKVEREEELPRAVRLAAQCAQAAMAAVEGRELTGGVRFRLRVGIGAGAVQLSDVGGEDGRWEFLACGEPLLQMAQAEHAASPGEIVLSDEAWKKLEEGAQGVRMEGGGWRLDRLEPVPLPEVRLAEPPPHLEPALRAYIPGMVLAQLDAGLSRWLAEFRNVSVMFINLGDASFAAGHRSAQLQEAFRAIQVALACYEGIATQVVVDDKGVVVVAAFGLPLVAHEDDATRAVYAGLEVHRALEGQGLTHRIGITSGRVFCGAYGNDTRREFVMVGHTVNMAARLMQAAADGPLCDAATARQAWARCSFQTLPPIRVKGNPQPLEIFRPLPARETGAQAPVKAGGRLVGREVERSRLEEALRALSAGKGGLVLVEGEAGLGKSRLLAHLTEVARAAGLEPCLGEGDALVQFSALHAWRNPLSQLLGLEALPDVAARTERLLARLRPERRDLAGLLNTVLPVAASESDVVRQLTGTLRWDNTRELLVELLEDAARERPLLIVLDDMHWMDPSSWELALFAQRQVERLLLVLSGRPLGERAPDEYRQLRERAGSGLLLLERMSQEDTLELVCQRLGVRALPAQVVEFIRDRAEGHPFFSEELALALRDAGFLEVEGGECRLSSRAGDLRALDLPGTVQGIITSRLDRLTLQQQLTLKVASVIGRVFASSVLREVYPVDTARPELLNQLEALTRLDLTQVEVSETSYAFKHALTQDATYNLMAFNQRRQLHRGVALFYERLLERGEEDGSLHEVLAHHWLRAEEPARALEHLEKAGNLVFARGANRNAIALFTQARVLADAHAAQVGPVGALRRAHWSARMGFAHESLGELDKCCEHLEEALRLLGRPSPDSKGGWGRRAVREAGWQLFHGLLGRWFPTTHDAEARERFSLAALINAHLGPQHVFRLDVLAWITCSLAAVNDAERAGDPVPGWRGYSGLGYLSGMMRLPWLANVYFRRSHDTDVQQDPITGEVNSNDTGEGLWHLGFGRWERGISLIVPTVERARLFNDRPNLSLLLGLLATALEFSRPLEEVIRVNEEQLASARKNANAQHLSWALIQLVRRLLAQERGDEAQALLVEAERLLGGMDRYGMTHYHATAALAALRRGDATRAAAEADQVLVLWRATAPAQVPDIQPVAILAKVCLELWEEARRSGTGVTIHQQRAEAACGVLRGMARAFPIARTRAERLDGVRARLAGEPQRALKLLERALAHARQYGMPHDEALALLELARTTQDAALRGEHLARARTLFDHLGQTHALRQVEALASGSSSRDDAPPSRNIA